MLCFAKSLGAEVCRLYIDMEAQLKSAPPVLMFHENA